MHRRPSHASSLSSRASTSSSFSSYSSASSSKSSGRPPVPTPTPEEEPQEGQRSLITWAWSTPRLYSGSAIVLDNLFFFFLQVVGGLMTKS